jgi:hypothetical protein
MARGRISRKRVQQALAGVQGDACLLQDLVRFERLKRWNVDLVAKCHPGDRTTAYRHLERLVQLGCLNKHAARGKGGGGSVSAVYFLSALGARVLTHALEREQPVTYVRPTSRLQETHDLAMTELAASWGLLSAGWCVQVPVHYVRDRDLVAEARAYLEALPAWREWQEKAPPWDAAQKAVKELRDRRDALARQIDDLEARWRECNERREEGYTRVSSKLRQEIVELRAQKEKLEWFDLRDAEKELERLEPPPGPRPEDPIPSCDLRSAYENSADPSLSFEEWAAALQPESAYFIPDLHACLSLQEQKDWLLCVEIEGRTEYRHIADKYRRYAEAGRMLDDRSLSLYVIFTSHQVAERALPQHRRVLNAHLREPGPWMVGVYFSDLDYLREIECERTPANLIWQGMQWLWETEMLEGMKLRGTLHKAYEEKWEKLERQRKERERKAYWASRT